MSHSEVAFCTAAPWRWFARRVFLPWALGEERLSGRVLELGAGSGAMAAEILDRFPETDLIATDLDPGMLDQARDTLGPAGPRAQVETADATALPYGDEEFSAVVSFMMLHHVGAWERALAEAARVLEPGGLLIAADFVEFPGLVAAERASGNPGVRPIRWELLQAEVRKRPFEAVRARRTARTVFRLRARKAR